MNEQQAVDSFVVMMAVPIILAVIWYNRNKSIRMMNFFRKNYETADDEQPLLLSYYSRGLDLQNMASGKHKGVGYSVLMTLKPSMRLFETWAPPGALIYRIEMPFHTEAHIVGLSKKHRLALPEVESFVKANHLERVTLEGNFPDIFSLFAAPGQQTQARYVFDPAAMAYVADYCKNNFWEIAGDELYFVSERDHQAGNVIANSAEFIDQIRPALTSAFSGKKQAKHEAPYGKYRGPVMKCPACATDLTQCTHWFECPSCNGHLLHGKDLIKANRGQIEAPENMSSTVTERPSSIQCPHCQNPMTIVDYQFSGVHIDTCTKCPYRWCDAGELAKIMP